MTRPESRGPRVSPRVVADWLGVRSGDLYDQIARGLVRTERIKDVLFIDLDDAGRALATSREGGVRR